MSTPPHSRWEQVYSSCRELCDAIGIPFMVRHQVGASPKPNYWITRLTAQLYHLDTIGALHFGGGRHDGTAVALWWLAQRVRDAGWDQAMVTSYISRLGAERRHGRT